MKLEQEWAIVGVLLIAMSFIFIIVFPGDEALQYIPFFLVIGISACTAALMAVATNKIYDKGDE